ncbi:hypothetical protein SAMN05216248_101534 [Pseudomonas simiae]|jgi:hypothetical protein|nr:hypothetical protein SAMN05216248_101534 [Pseudomonas simiae]
MVVGPGYRMYFVRTGITAYLRLWGRDKTDQKRGAKTRYEMIQKLMLAPGIELTVRPIAGASKPAPTNL